MTDSPYASLAEIYEAIRPSYPDELFSDILFVAELPEGAHLMEIGAGTGKATEAFLSRHYCVDAVELEESMAEILHKKCVSPKLHLSVDTFESWMPPRKNYDMIYCAQAFHWLDPKTKFQKCRDYLSPSGCLALIWYDPQPTPDTSAHRASDAVKRQYFGPSDMAVSVPMNTRLQEIETAPGFHLHFQKKYFVTLHNTPRQSLLAMQSTPAFSEKFRTFPAPKQEAFIREYTAAIEENGGTHHVFAPLGAAFYFGLKHHDVWVIL